MTPVAHLCAILASSPHILCAYDLAAELGLPQRHADRALEAYRAAPCGESWQEDWAEAEARVRCGAT